MQCAVYDATRKRLNLYNPGILDLVKRRMKSKPSQRQSDIRVDGYLFAFALSPFSRSSFSFVSHLEPWSCVTCLLSVAKNDCPLAMLPRYR